MRSTNKFEKKFIFFQLNPGQDGHGQNGQNRLGGVKNRHYNKYKYLYIVSQMTASEIENDHFDLDHFDRDKTTVAIRDTGYETGEKLLECELCTHLP